MPVYNAAPFLHECLSSIRAQSYGDWELIAVDDFSTDESYEILNKFAQIEKRILVLKNREKGIIPALRLAYSESKGEYLTRMDADDIMIPNKLEALLGLVEDGTIATGKVEYFRDQGDLGPGYTRYADWLNDLIDKDSHWNSIYKECVIPSPAWMMTKRTLDSIDSFLPDNYPEDYDLIFRCYRAGFKVKSTTELIHSWRDHAERASRTDSNYADNRFLDIKLRYFLEIEYEPQKPLILWGAGAKGKYLAKQFLENGICFLWVTENIRKQRIPIYNKPLQGVDSIPAESNCIIAVAGRLDQKQIRAKLSQLKDVKSFWFC